MRTLYAYGYKNEKEIINNNLEKRSFEKFSKHLCFQNIIYEFNYNVENNSCQL